MIDITTKKPLQVSPYGRVRPYIMLPLDQLKEVQEVLEANSIRHTVDENVISMNEGPFIATIDLGRGADPDAIQAILDSESLSSERRPHEHPG
ncbi:MAG TPA: hypothetical protein DDY78_08445, partial [Planctomycetales bacterium]|nr:hypothetical protein [Planctomycetales bacterium]